MQYVILLILGEEGFLPICYSIMIDSWPRHCEVLVLGNLMCDPKQNCTFPNRELEVLGELGACWKAGFSVVLFILFINST